ncbi:glycosyltransferase family 39 protein [Flavitalea antarctica]
MSFLNPGSATAGKTMYTPAVHLISDGKQAVSNKVLLYILFLLKIILPFLIQDGYYQPHRDEFLYLAEGKHLAWGYLEVPPVLSVFAWLIHLAGGGEFWIKLWPNLVGGFCWFLVGRTILDFKGGKFALVLGFLPFIFGGYLRVFHLFQPNFIEIFFWTLIGFSLVKFISTQKTKWLYFFGISLGLGMLSKYTVAFYIIALLGGLLFTDQRKIFRNPHFYGAAAIALVIFLPNFIWQYQHKFPVITHMNELKETQLQYNETGEFITSQFMMNLPAVFVWLAGLVYLIFSPKGRPFRFYAWAFFIVVLLMIYFKGKGYYILGIYPLLFAFGATWLERLTEVSWRWTRYAMLVFAIGTGLVAVPILLPVAKPDNLVKYYETIGSYKAGDYKWEDLKQHPLPQDFADMMGWKEITAMTARAYAGIPEPQKSRTIVIGSSYAFAGALNYYGPALGLPEVYSTNASFLLWLPEKFDFDHMLYVDDDYSRENPIFRQFSKVTELGKLDLPMFREDGTRVFLFENANDSLHIILDGYIKTLKGKFLR